MSNTEVRFPFVHVTLVGSDGNALAVLGKVSRAMKDGGVSRTERDEFMEEATSGDYNHLLATCMKWVDVK